MRHILTILGLAALIAAAVSMIHNSSHGLGTGANSWDHRSFGWPVEIWSRTEHVYRTVTISPGGRKVETVRYPTRYSVRWTNAVLVLAGALAAGYAVSVWVLPSKGNEYGDQKD
jgi:hypothetical protein